MHWISTNRWKFDTIMTWIDSSVKFEIAMAHHLPASWILCRMSNFAAGNNNVHFENCEKQFSVGFIKC